MRFTMRLKIFDLKIRAALIQFNSIERFLLSSQINSRLLWFFIMALGVWLKSLWPFCQSIRSATKTNCDSGRQGRQSLGTRMLWIAHTLFPEPCVSHMCWLPFLIGSLYCLCPLPDLAIVGCDNFRFALSALTTLTWKSLNNHLVFPLTRWWKSKFLYLEINLFEHSFLVIKCGREKNNKRG